MKTFANLLISLILAFWITGVAILSVQNAEPVSLRFFTFQSIQIPIGLVLTFCSGIGIISIALLQPLWGLTGTEQRNLESEDDVDFFVDEE